MAEEFNLSNHITEAKEIWKAVQLASQGSTGQSIITSKSTFLHTSFVEKAIVLIKEVIPNFVDDSYPKGLHDAIDKIIGNRLIIK